MNTLKGVALATLAAVAISAWTPTLHAETATIVAAADSKTSDADKRAKAADCSKQADEKKLHGAERKKFREACKRK